MNNVINEIKNTPVGTKSSIMEVEDRMAKINETERKKKKEIERNEDRGGGKDGGGIGREDHFLPHEFLKRTFQRRANFTKQLL